MTNAAGYSSFTNLTVVRSDDVNLTIDDVPQDQLATGLVTVTGTIDSTNFTVWVNGVVTTNVTDNGNGTWHWEAYDVPLNSGGTATIQAVAIPNSVNGGQGTGMEPWIDNAVLGNPKAPDRRGKETDPEKSEGTYVKHYHATYDNVWKFTGDMGAWTDCHLWWAVDWTNPLALSTGPLSANGLQFGTYHEDEVWTVAYPGSDPQEGGWHWNQLNYLFPQPRGMEGQYTLTNTPDGPNTSGTVGASLWSNNRFWDEATPYTSGPSYIEGLGWGMTIGTIDRTERIQIKLRTGGKRLSKWKSFFRFWGAATNYPAMDSTSTWVPDTVPPESIQVLGKPLITNGIVYPYGMNYKALPDNEEHDITPIVQAQRYQFDVKVQKHKLILQHHCVIGNDTNRTDLGVGEQVTLKFIPDLALNNYWSNHWSTSAGSVSPDNGNQTSFTAPSNRSPATVTAKLRDEQVDVGFGVVEPSGSAYAQVTDTDCWYYLPAAMAGMHLRVVMGPTNVSLYRVQVLEVPGGPTKVQGWFSIYGAPQHDAQHRAGQWYQLGCDNAWPGNDYASSDVYNQPWSGSGWSGGSFTWHIPVKWKIDGGQEQLLDGWDQDFALLGDGTVTITKFGHTVTRHANQNCGTAQ